MNSKVYTIFFLGSLIGSTLCVIPDGEIQIGPIFGKGGKIFGGNKHFEAVFDKAVQLKPLIAKKVLIGVGALGAGALAAGGAALIAKKLPHLGHGWGWASKGYDQGHYNNYNNYHQGSASYGWSGNTGGYYQTPSSAVTEVKFPSSYPTSATDYGNNYPATDYGYNQNDWHGSSYGGSLGWAR